MRARRVKEPPTAPLVDRDSATRRARRLGVQFDVGELCFVLRSVRNREAIPALKIHWQHESDDWCLKPTPTGLSNLQFVRFWSTNISANCWGAGVTPLFRAISVFLAHASHIRVGILDGRFTAEAMTYYQSPCVR